MIMQTYTFDQLSVIAQNNAYCEWLSVLSFDDGMEDTSKEFFANMMQNDSCFDVEGEFIDDDDYED